MRRENSKLTPRTDASAIMRDWLEIGVPIPEERCNSVLGTATELHAAAGADRLTWLQGRGTFGEVPTFCSFLAQLRVHRFDRSVIKGYQH